MNPNEMLSRSLLAAGAAALLASGLAACGSADDGGSATSASKGPAKELKLQLTDDGCTPANATVPAGNVKVVVENPGTAKSDEVELKNGEGIIMGERENIAPGLATDFTLTLQPGRYVLNCTFQNEQRDNGAITVTGTAATASDVSEQDLDRAVVAYKAYVAGETETLLRQTRAFVAAVKAGDVAKAKALFGPTRLHYETVEPIAESFGNLDPEIDARVNDVADRSRWTGFHKLEQLLWQQNTTAGADRYADKLLADVTRLHDAIPGLRLQAAQVANGAVGLLDEVSSSKITGEEDRYSHTDLSDFQGNFSGAREAFEVLKPALIARGDRSLVDEIEQRMAAVQEGLDKYRRDTPLGFAPYSELTARDRRQFAQQIAALAEPLSLVAGRVLPNQS
ncbi:iron uptake system protein EfeO [Conexibacter sp. JD483]|uniref:iron uptake system protein EfeO n=1 Tax=unclassified Conexibacter TaxID=2627773 RepID=UPI0027228C33|nr:MULTISPECIES: iron uptake system protein EfeO [unclassified Conexibacter]MDO8185753.1 iron uptake system protein EfeO [Conexibacter sp. CPCC 205706]MDO8199130.1 iron uptake system protein EfeO [Conexibacter sp. CPCC 205762]MDR9369925.1 iron uptake system protein EfeO [Conexibacter sp. JD483]